MFPSLGLAVRMARGYAACLRWRVSGTRVAGGGDASTGLMPEQKLVVPACPRRESGHLWRFDRRHSTEDCQADACQACGLVRMTSYRTGQVMRYAGSGADDGNER